MKPIIEFSKILQIFNFWLFTVIMPIVMGALIGVIGTKIKPNALKRTLTITAVVSVVFIGVVLLTLHNQALPGLAIFMSAAAIIVINVSAAIAHKLVNSKYRINK